MKLSEIQKALKAPKSQYNSFGKYYYRNCEDILEAVKPLLGDAVLTISDEIVNVGDRYYVKATATLLEHFEVLGNDVDRFKQHTVTAYAREALDKKGMDDAQITGAASSYARKYALNGLFLIDDTKDADHDEPKDAPVAPKKASTSPVMSKVSASIDSLKEDARVKNLAASDRIKTLLAKLGSPVATPQEMKEAVKKYTGIDLTVHNLEEVGEKLAEVVAQQ